MNILCERKLSTHDYSLELPDWLCNSKDIKVICEAYEYYRNGKYKCVLSENKYQAHFKLSKKEIKNIIDFYNREVKGDSNEF